MTNRNKQLDNDLQAAWTECLKACNREAHTVMAWLVNAARREVVKNLTEAEDEVLRAERFPGEVSCAVIAAHVPEDRIGEAQARVGTNRAKLRFLLALDAKLNDHSAKVFGEGVGTWFRGKRETEVVKK